MTYTTANVKPGIFVDSSDDEPFDLKRRGETPKRTVELKSPVVRPTVLREKAMACHSLVGVIRQVQVRLLAKSLRYWLTKPARSRLEQVHMLETKLEHVRGASLMLSCFSKTQTVKGVGEFMLRLSLSVCEESQSDAEWESAAEHIQKLRDLLGSQLLTSVVDKSELRHLFSAFAALRMNVFDQPELVS
jgi:hypothetical protein